MNRTPDTMRVGGVWSVRVLTTGSGPATVRDAGTRLGVEPAVDPVNQCHPIRRPFALPTQYQRCCADGNDYYSHEIPLWWLDKYYDNTILIYRQVTLLGCDGSYGAFFHFVTKTLTDGAPK